MKITKKLADKLKKLTVAELAEDGSELLNPVPLVADVQPVGETIEAKIQRAIAINELSRQAAEQGNETWEEFNDFDVEDPEDIPIFRSDYEIAKEEYIENERPIKMEIEQDVVDDNRDLPTRAGQDPEGIAAGLEPAAGDKDPPADIVDDSGR